MSSKKIASRLERLQPRITKTAKYIHAPGLESDDLEQIMALRILERAAQIHDLENQSDSYLMQDAYRNGGLKAAIKDTIYTKYVDSEDALQPADDENEFDGLDFTEIIPSKYMSVEDTIIIREETRQIEKAIKDMNPKYKTVVRLLVVGYSESEIAAYMGVTKSAISQRKAVLRKTLQDSNVNQNSQDL
jgi:RNA polymerase sigma factor (sigma-70 family)